MTPIDPAKAKAKTTFNHPGTFYALCADSGRKRVYAGSDDTSIYVFDPESEKKEPLARWSRHDNYVSGLVFLERPIPNIVSASYDRRLIWWDVDKGEPIRTVEEAHQGWIRDLIATPDGNLLITCGDDMLVKLWDTETGRLVRMLAGHATQTPQGHVTALYTVAVSPDGNYLAGGDRIGEVRVWETATGTLAQTFKVPVLYTYDPRQRKRSMGGIRALAFSADGNLLASGGIGQVGNVDGLLGPAHVEIWDWRKPQQRVAAQAQGHKGIINQLAFHPSGWLIGAGGGSDNGFLAFWQLDKLADATLEQKDPVPVQRIKADGHFHRFCLHPEKPELFAAGFHKMEVWSLGA